MSGELIVLPTEPGMEGLPAELRLGRTLYSFEDIADANGVNLEHLRERFGVLPIVVQVPEGDEDRYASALLDHPGRFKAAVPNARTSLALLRPNRAAIARCLRVINATSVPECGAGVRVAVLDTGVSRSVMGRSSALAHHQIDTHDPDPARAAPQTPDDMVGHGTLVAYLIHAVAPAAEIHSVRVAGSEGTLLGVLAGLYLAEAQIAPDIFNMSLGVDLRPGRCRRCRARIRVVAGRKEQVRVFLDQVRRRRNGDEPLFVASAGNQVRDLLVPASIEGVLAVGAFDVSEHDHRAPYSRHLRIPADSYVMAPGGSKTDSDCLGSYPASRLRPSVEKLLAGTSFATGFVTGVATRFLCDMCGGKASGFNGTTDAFLRQQITSSANRSFPGYDRRLHGIGLLQHC